MCKYQRILDSGLPFCAATNSLCDLCVYGTQNHLKEGEKEEKKELGERDRE